MAPTRPLKHAQIECARTVPVPKDVRQGSVNVKSVFERREEMTDTLVLNLKGNSQRLPSSTNGKEKGSRDSAIPTLKKALLNFKHGNDGHVIWALRAVSRIKHCLNTQDLWNTVDHLGEGARDELEVKTDYVRAACLSMMVDFHKEICSRVAHGEGVNGKERVVAAESGDIVRKAIPSVDAKAVEAAVVEEAEERRNRIIFEGRMAEVILKILEDESNHPELRGAAERAVYEIDSPILREMIVKGIEEVQRSTGLIWGDIEQAEKNRESARELILITYLADVEEAETIKYA
jgi:hypothetical protein